MSDLQFSAPATAAPAADATPAAPAADATPITVWVLSSTSSWEGYASDLDGSSTQTLGLYKSYKSAKVALRAALMEDDGHPDPSAVYPLLWSGGSAALATPAGQKEAYERDLAALLRADEGAEAKFDFSVPEGKKRGVHVQSGGYVGRKIRLEGWETAVWSEEWPVAPGSQWPSKVTKSHSSREGGCCQTYCIESAELFP